jgi:hypothetical protein
MTVAQANAIDAQNGTGITTGAIDVTSRVAGLKTLTGTEAAYTIVIAGADATSAAADLALIDGATTVAVNAAAVTTVTGTATEVAAYAAADAATTITAATNYAATVSGTDMTVAQANAIDAQNGTGVITGTIDGATRVAGLVMLTGTEAVSAYVITILGGPGGDATSPAADLLAIDAATTVAVNALAVTTVTGTATEVAAYAAAEFAGTIAAPADYDVTLSDTTLDASQAEAINAFNGTGTIDISAATTINATRPEYLSIVANTGSNYLTKADVDVTIAGPGGFVTVTEYATIESDTTGTIDATVDMDNGNETLNITSINDRIDIVNSSANDVVNVTAPSFDTTEVIGNFAFPAAYNIENAGNGVVVKANNGTLTEENLTAATLTAVAASINGAFSFNDGAGAEFLQTEIFFVEADTGHYGIYSWTQSHAGDTTVAASELTLIGTNTRGALLEAEVGVI